MTTHPSDNLSIKGAEQVRIPGSWLVNLAIDVVKGGCSVVENFGNNEGAFPSRGEFVWLLLVHSKDQVSFLEGSALHVSGIESTQVLLIDGRSDHGHLSFLF